MICKFRLHDIHWKEPLEKSHMTFPWEIHTWNSRFSHAVNVWCFSHVIVTRFISFHFCFFNTFIYICLLMIHLFLLFCDFCTIHLFSPEIFRQFLSMGDLFSVHFDVVFTRFISFHIWFFHLVNFPHVVFTQFYCFYMCFLNSSYTHPCDFHKIHFPTHPSNV